MNKPKKTGQKLIEECRAGRSYTWCPYHEAWTQYKESECNLAHDGKGGKAMNAELESDDDDGQFCDDD